MDVGAGNLALRICPDMVAQMSLNKNVISRDRNGINVIFKHWPCR
jgi:hypothetical protein